MKPMQVADDIVPLGKFKTHASRVLRSMKASGRAVVITQHGKPAAVVMTPAEFDRLRYSARVISAVNEGRADIAAGRVIGDRDLERELDAEFGPLRR